MFHSIFHFSLLIAFGFVQLAKAAMSSDPETVHELLQKPHVLADINRPVTLCRTSAADSPYTRAPALLFAIRPGEHEIASASQREGVSGPKTWHRIIVRANRNQQLQEKYHSQPGDRKLAVVQALCEAKADVRLAGRSQGSVKGLSLHKDFRTPLIHAIQSEHVDIVNLLLKYGADAGVECFTNGPTSTQVISALHLPQTISPKMNACVATMRATYSVSDLLICIRFSFVSLFSRLSRDCLHFAGSAARAALGLLTEGPTRHGHRVHCRSRSRIGEEVPQGQGQRQQQA